MNLFKKWYDKLYKLFNKPTIWVISDTHFFHKNIIEYSGLPFNDEYEMAGTLIRNWNELVKPNDVVIHLGDFGFGGKEKLTEIAKQLNGYKILVTGNHDRHSNSFYRSIFNEVHKGYFRREFNDKLIHFLHNPNETSKYYLNPNKHYIIYGHLHNKKMTYWPDRCTYCACIEHTNFKPVKLTDIIKFWKENSEFGFWRIQ